MVFLIPMLPQQSLLTLVPHPLMSPSSSFSFFHSPLSHDKPSPQTLRVKSYGHSNLRGHSISTFERHDILCAWIVHLRKNFCLLEFARVFLLTFWVSQLVFGLMQISGGMVMDVSICDGLHFSTTSISIYHKHQSDTCFKSYGHLNLHGHTISTFERHYILSGSIGHPSQNFFMLELSRVFHVKFYVSQ